MNFYASIGITVIVAGLIAFFMFKIQKRKEKDADDQFELTMKSHGLSTEIEKPKHVMMHAEVELTEEGRIPTMELPDDIEVRDENFDLSLIGKVQKKRKTSKKVAKKKSSKKKKTTKRK